MATRPEDVEAFIDAGSEHAEAPPPRQEGRQPDAPKHDQQDVDLAKFYGFTDAEIARMTPEQLVRDVARVQRATEQRTQTILQNYRQAAPSSQPPPPPPEPSVWGDDEDEWEEDGKVVKRKAKDDDFHPALARVIKRQQKELAELKQKLGVVNEHVEGRARSEMAEAIDGGFEDLGEEFVGIFGDGTYETLQEGSDEAERRQLVWQRVRNSLAGKPAPTAKRIRQLVAQEARKLFGRVGGQPKPQQTQPQEPYNGGYEGADARLRRTPPPRPTDPHNNNRFLSDAEINRRAEEARVRAMYENNGVEQPTRRGAPTPKQSREAAIEGVEELRRNWQAEEVEQGGNGKFEV